MKGISFFKSVKNGHMMNKAYLTPTFYLQYDVSCYPRDTRQLQVQSTRAPEEILLTQILNNIQCRNTQYTIAHHTPIISRFDLIFRRLYRRPRAGCACCWFALRTRKPPMPCTAIPEQGNKEKHTRKHLKKQTLKMIAN